MRSYLNKEPRLETVKISSRIGEQGVDDLRSGSDIPQQERPKGFGELQCVLPHHLSNTLLVSAGWVEREWIWNTYVGNLSPFGCHGPIGV